MNTTAQYPCSRCGSKGRIPIYANVLGGVCFQCGGSGFQKTKPREPSKRWAVIARRTTDNQPDVYIRNIRARTEGEALKKALRDLLNARENVYDPASIRVSPIG